MQYVDFIASKTSFKQNDILLKTGVICFNIILLFKFSAYFR